MPSWRRYPLYPALFHIATLPITAELGEVLVMQSYRKIACRKMLV
jgi:hypothetical protein